MFERYGRTSGKMGFWFPRWLVAKQRLESESAISTTGHTNSVAQRGRADSEEDW